MHKIQKILTGTFLIGVLLGGIGTGVALSEYSSFAYAGEKQIGAGNLTTKELDFAYDPEKGKLILAPIYCADNTSPHKVQADNTVPRGMVRYTITYNAETVEPILIFQEYETPEETDVFETEQSQSDNSAAKTSEQGYLELRPNYIGNDFALWMETKDQFLGEIKQKKISSYDITYITDVKIKVNPMDMEQIVDHT